MTCSPPIADRFLPGIRTYEQAILGEPTSTERATQLKLLDKVLKGTATINGLLGTIGNRRRRNGTQPDFPHHQSGASPPVANNAAP